MEDTMVETVENNVAQEPQAEAQPGTTQPDDSAIENQLTQEITTLWSDHVRLSTDRKTTAKELRQIRARLAERLHEMKSLLCRPDRGRASQWRGWLRQQGIPRSTADRLVARYDETLCRHSESMPSGAPSEPVPLTVEELAKGVWQRVGKFLSTGELVVRFIGCIAEISGVGHEQRDEGLVIFNSAPKPADEVPASAPATEPELQRSDEASAATQEPAVETAAAPLAAGQTAAIADADSGDVV